MSASSRPRRVLARIRSLASDWRATRDRGLDGPGAAMAAEAKVMAQRWERGTGAARRRVARLRPGSASTPPVPTGSEPSGFGHSGFGHSTHHRGTGRPRVLLICYACKRGAGSEEGVGWTWAVAAAAVADVTVLTQSVVVDDVRAAAAELGLPIEVVGCQPQRWLRPMAFRRWGGFVYYTIWQSAAGRVVRRLERSGEIDVVHHLTWASDSLPSALIRSRAPIRIWGPVGGSTHTQKGLLRYLTVRSQLEERFRDAVNEGWRRVAGDRVARHASLVVALNDDVRARFAKCPTPVIVEPNCAIYDSELEQANQLPGVAGDGPLCTAVFAGRLIAWKGLQLAVESLQYAPDWRLVVFGDGPEREAAQAQAAELGVAHRLELRGVTERAEVLAAFRTANALLAPSFHDSAPWAVGEASTLGCPVVCLDAGGTALLAAKNAHVVAIEPAPSLPERLGACLQGLHERGEPDRSWSADRLPGLLASWYGAAADQSAAVSPVADASGALERDRAH